jgi:hypothetical protein
MKYMLLIVANREEWSSGLTGWSPEDIQAMVRYMDDLNRELVASGELVEANGLAGPAQAKTVRAQPDDGPVVTDGPYPESKEVLAGYWVVDVPTEARAIEIAARASAAPGPGGVPVNQPIEVHPVAEAPRV